MSDTVIEGVVATLFDPNTETIEWRDVPGFTNYQASETGAIRRKTGYGYRYSKFSEHKTSKGFYLRVSAMSDNGKDRSKGVHILVCLAFKGLPPTDDKYEVNHIDGNKLNNLPSNLEWRTRSKNLDHAHENNLRKESVAVLMKDHIEETITRFYSLGEMGRQFGLDPRVCSRIVNKHSVEKWNSRYTFSMDLGDRKVTKFSWVTNIYALDCSTGSFAVFTDSLVASIHTEVNRMTILYQLRNKRTIPVNGWSFARDPADLPAMGYYSEEVVRQSIEDYAKPL